MVIRWVGDDNIIYEDLIGMHHVDKCNANSIVKILKTVLFSMNLDIMQVRCQTYDGASDLQERCRKADTDNKSKVSINTLSKSQLELDTTESSFS